MGPGRRGKKQGVPKLGWGYLEGLCLTSSHVI